MVGKQIVVVTIQYRLGSLGFLSSGDPQLPGNVGLWDMALAVQWVRNHIGFFGGNPHKIVVMGHGTGASSALFLALSNIAKGFYFLLFKIHKIIFSLFRINKCSCCNVRKLNFSLGCGQYTRDNVQRSC